MKSSNYKKLARLGFGIFLLLFTASTIIAQPNWPVTPTGDNHTIIIQADIVQDINGGSLSPGDSVGVFYDNGGTLACAGKAEWTGANISVTAYGDDNSTASVKEGFDNSETFMWKVWIASSNQEVDATATYKATDIVISHGGEYAVNGISSVESLTATDGGGSTGPDWPVTVTGDNHTVIIEAGIPIDLNGESIAVGDYIGAFYDDNGTLRCAGKDAWTGENFSIAVYGDDNTTTGVKEGFSAGEIFSWKVWRAATEEEADATATYKPTDIVISHTDAFAVNGISALASLTVDGGGGGTPDWVVVPTSENHTLVIPASIQSRIGGSPIANGDYVGVFYRDLNGVEKCAGLGIWQDQILVFPAYGNDAGPFGKNGFDPGDTFVWKVWKASESQEYNVVVTYLPVGGVYTDQQFYSNNGVSGVATIFSDIQQQSIFLNEGWNLISSYINPVDANLSTIFSAISSKVDIVKNGAGDAYIPNIHVNQIGDWNYKKGYSVRANANTVLTLYGTIVDPTTPINLPAGWSLLPYLRTTSQSIAIALGAILPDVVEVKDANGNSFIPSFGIDNIGFLVPGQAYKIRMARDATLIYTARLASSQVTWTQNTLTPLHFNTNTHATNNSATLVLPKEITQNVLSVGDEISATNSTGLLVGSAVYEGNHLAITVRGDDKSTSEVEGLKSGELINFHIWNRAKNEANPVSMVFESNLPTYSEDELMVARKIITNGEWALNILNNPVQEAIQLQINLPKTVKPEIHILNQLGQLVKAWQGKEQDGNIKLTMSTDQLAQGVYYVKLFTNDQAIVKKLVLLK